MIYCTTQAVLLPFTKILFTKNVHCAIFKLFEQMIKYMRKGKKGTFKVSGNYNYYKIILTGKKSNGKTVSGCIGFGKIY